MQKQKKSSNAKTKVKADASRNRLEWASSFAKKKKGKLKSKHINGNCELVSFVCKKNHKWKIRFDKLIDQKRWCKICSTKFVSQGKLLEILKTIYKGCTFKANYRRLDFFKNPLTKKNLEVDIFIVDRKNNKKIAIEYDGEHHFKPIDMFGGKKRYQKQILLDSLKNELMKNNKDKVQHFVRFSYKDNLNKETIVKRLEECGAINEKR